MLCKLGACSSSKAPAFCVHHAADTDSRIVRAGRMCASIVTSRACQLKIVITYSSMYSAEAVFTTGSLLIAALTTHMLLCAPRLLCTCECR
jgi:hypothetical protein